jgi:hypothetical protein
MTKNTLRVINEMANSLKERYDAISKMDAAKFLKELYPNMTLKEFMEAYKFAYE